MPRRWLLPMLAALAPATATPVYGQGLEISGAAVVSQLRSTVLFQGTREAASGVWVGGAVGIQMHRFALDLTASRGTLGSSGNSTVIKRNGGDIRAWLSIRATSWLGLEGGYGVRAFSSLAGFQQWNTPAVGVRLTMPLGTHALRADTRWIYLPGASVSGQPSVSLGLLSEVGVTADLGRMLVARLSYRLERYDFTGGAAARVEQLDGIALRVGVRLGRGGKK